MHLGRRRRLGGMRSVDVRYPNRGGEDRDLSAARAGDGWAVRRLASRHRPTEVCLGLIDASDESGGPQPFDRQTPPNEPPR
jgi:hypothetical protein